MARALLKTRGEVLRDMTNALVARGGLTDVTRVSDIRRVLESVSDELEHAYISLGLLRFARNINRARGADLDALALEFPASRLTRYGPRRAIGELQFDRITALGTPAPIAVGTVIRTSDGIEVETTEAGTIDAGETSTSTSTGGNPAARARRVGTDGNIAAGTAVIFSSKPAGVDLVTNLSFVNGRDRETDDAFRRRILGWVAALSRCTVEALENILLGLEDPGGSGKQIVFTHIEEPITAPGTFIEYIDDGAGTVVESEDIAGFSTTITAMTAPDGAGLVTATLAGNVAEAQHVGRHASVWDAVNAANVGVFTIIAVPAVNQIVFSNPAGVVEAVSTATLNVGEAVTLGLLGPPNNAAVGGEDYLTLDNRALVVAGLSLRSHGPAAVARGALTADIASGGAYDVDLASGLLRFDPQLANGEVIVATYTRYTGLLAEAQDVIDGKPADRLNYPGYRAAGCRGRVLTPTVRVISVTGILAIDEGYARATVVAAARAAVLAYINGAGISQDIIRYEIVERIMATPGVINVSLLAPLADTTIADDEIARTSLADISLQ